MTIPVTNLHDLAEVAKAWGVSPHTVRKWVKQGKLKPLRICRRLLFHPDDLERFISIARTGAESSAR